jgi:predicted MFS family arabinose efflux permease
MAMAIIGDVFPDERRGRATGALMSAFSLASVAGIPFGLYMGTTFGWHVPFLMLAALGCPVLAVAALTLPPLRDHVGQTVALHPLRAVVEMFRHANHLWAFTLIGVLMIGGFAVSPFVSAYLVANVGITEENLPWVFVVAGSLTFFSAPAIGWWSDRYGKLLLFRVLIPMSAAVTVIVTSLPAGRPYLAVAAVSVLFIANSGRMIPAMAMVTGSVVPQRRGGFMSANSSIQHLSAGLGSFLGGLLVTEGANKQLEHFGTVGVLGAAVTLSTLWIAGRLRPATVAERPITVPQSLAAAAEGAFDVGEPLVEAE